MADPTTHPSRAATRLRKARSVYRPGHDPAVREESLRQVRAALQKAGFELDKFDDLKRRNDANMREALAKSRTAADGRVPAMRDAVARSTEHWLTANGLGPALSARKKGVYALTTADQITAPGFASFSHDIAPWANSAEVILDRSTQDVDYFDKPVTFTFSWVNQTGQSNLFTVTALLGVTATCDVTADSNWWPLTIVPPSSTLDVGATLGITVVADDGQVIEPPFQPSQSQQVLELFVDSSWLSGTINGKDVFGTYILQYYGLYLQANGQVEFDLTCEVSWVAVDGGCGFVAAGHGRQVTAPGVIVTTQPWVIT